MKLRSIAFFALFCFITSNASWAEQSVGAGVQYQTVTDYDDPGAAANLRVAYSVLPQLALQAEISSTVSYPELEVFNGSGNSVGFTDFYALTAGVYAAYQQPLGERFFVRGRLGAVYTAIEEETCIVGDCETETDSATAFSYGAAAGFKLMSALSLVAEWTQASADVSHAGLTLEYAF